MPSPSQAASPESALTPTSAPEMVVSGGSTWNSALVAAVGLGGGSPRAALADALQILDEAAGSLLDRLPFPVAADVAWTARSSPWVRAWLAAVPARRLGAEAAPVWARILDWFWPVGQAMEVEVAGGAHAGLGGNGGFRFRLERDGDGVRVGGTFSLGGVANEGVGVEVGGAGADLVAGLGAGAALGMGGAVTAMWRLGSTVPGAAGAVGAYLDRPRALAEALMGDLLVSRTPPESWRVEGAAGGSLSAAAGEVHLQGGVGLGAGGSVAVGMEHDRAYVELGLGGSLAGRLAGSLVDRLTAFGELSGGMLSLSLARGLTVRAEGTEQAIARGDFTEAEFVLTERSTDFLTRTADTLRTRDPRVAAAWLLERVIPGGAPAGADTPARRLAVSALPELTLVREVSRPLVDLDRIDLVAPRLTAALTDALPDHGVLVGLETAEAVGAVAVGPAAVRAAVPEGSVPVLGSPEEAVLAIERRVAAAAVGGGEGGGPAADYDLPAGVAAVEMRGARVIGRARVALGGAAQLGLGLDLEADGEGTMVLERAVDMSGDTAAARDVLLG